MSLRIPPIAVSARVTLPYHDERVRDAMAALCRAHGYESGVVPLDSKAPDALVEAVAMLLTSHEVRLLVTAIGDDGTPVFEMAPREPTEGT